MDRFKEMKSFVAVADRGSFAAAAAEEGVTPVVIGRRIDALERRLGARLLYRSTRRLTLTEDGAVFLEHCRRVLADVDAAEGTVSAGRHAAVGHLVISAPAGFGRQHVARHGSAFIKEHPQLRLSFNLSDRVVDLVREGYDLGIRIGGELDPNYVAIKLASNRRVVCGTPAYFRRRGKPKALEDLARHNCLAFNLEGGQQRGWLFRRGGRQVNVRVSGNLDCNDGELLHRWALEGLGIAWRSTWEIARELERGELVTVLDAFALPSYDIHAVYPQHRNVPARLRLFVDYLKRAYARPGYWSRGP
ncbi:MAG: LysR family transcriptional regulator [Betaproteobacteria bacterium]|nr:LysR family transcriptional regulator [Betaproteobacteria bacterium]